MTETQKLFYRIREHFFAVMNKDNITDSVTQEVANALKIRFADLDLDVLEKEQ